MIITKTPLRISFFGGGTDYPIWYKKNGGAVLSTAINKHIYIVCRHSSPYFTNYNYNIHYREEEKTKTIVDIRHPSVRECLAYLNYTRGIESHYIADIPANSGIGSSSAFTVGFLKALYELKGEKISQKDLALRAIHIEQDKIKENVGSQDQTIAAFGGFRKIIFGGTDKIKVSRVNMDKDRMEDFQNHLILFLTGFRRVASLIAAEQITNTPNKALELKRMRQMVDEAEDILLDKKRNLNDFGTLLHEAWTIKKSLSSQVTTPEIDDIYQMGINAGATGGKLLGAGGGGFILFFAKPEFHQRIIKKLKDLTHVPFRFEEHGSEVILHTSDGEL